MTTMHKGVVLTALSLLAASIPLAADTPPTPTQTYDTGTARDLGMGGAATAVADDLALVLWNPAAAARIQDHQFVYSDSFRTVPKGLRFVSYGQAPEDGPTGALSFLRVDNGTYDLKENTLMYSFGQRVSDVLTAGASVKYSRYQRLGHSKEAFNVDLGLLYDASDTVTVGAAVLNANEPRMMDEVQVTSALTVPAAEAARIINVGAVYRMHPQVEAGKLGSAPLSYRTLLSLEVFDASDAIRRQLRVGVEHRLSGRVVARAGLLSSTPTLGLGYSLGAYSVSGAVLLGRPGERPTESVIGVSGAF